jgi:Na+-transporting methylmalonyl-CoA/oxaloacetate decarboxylase gamma subunit
MLLVLFVTGVSEFASRMESTEGDTTGKHSQASAQEKQGPEKNKRAGIEELGLV